MRAKHKATLRLAKGYRGRASRVHKVAKGRVETALQHAYVGRKLKKRAARSLWIQRLNAAVRAESVSYRDFIPATRASGIALNRKVLSELAIAEPHSFRAVFEVVRVTGLPWVEAQRDDCRRRHRESLEKERTLSAEQRKRFERVKELVGEEEERARAMKLEQERLRMQDMLTTRPRDFYPGGNEGNGREEGAGAEEERVS